MRGLVELVFVVGILGLFAALVIPHQPSKAVESTEFTTAPRVECYEIRQDGQTRHLVSYADSVGGQRLFLRTDPKRDDYDYMVTGSFEARIVPCPVEVAR